LPKDSAPIHEACSLLRRLLLHAAPSEQQCREVQEEREQQFLASYRLVSSLLASKPGMSSPALESSLLLPSISYISLVRRQNLQEPPAQYDFYRHPNPAEAVAVVPLLAAVSARVLVLLDQFPENPLLEQVLKVKARVLALPAGAPLPQLLTALELLLTSCHEWQKNAHRGVSLQDQMDQLTQLILRWRKLELSSWSLLLASVLARLREETGQFWLHLVGVVMEASSPREEVVRALVRFLEAATVADFPARLEMLCSVGRLLDMIGHRRLSLRAALRNLATYYSGMLPRVQRALVERTRVAEGKVKEFTKMARWKDTSFWSVRSVVDKSRKMLHKSMREYQKAVSVPAKTFFVEAEVENKGLKEVRVRTIGEVLVRGRQGERVWVEVRVRNGAGKEFGSLQHLARRAERWRDTLVQRLAVTEVSQLREEASRQLASPSIPNFHFFPDPVALPPGGE
jgi:midasin (ATPase involved in ribosome maturation)